MRQSFPAGLFYLQPAYCAVPAATIGEAREVSLRACPAIRVTWAGALFPSALAQSARVSLKVQAARRLLSQESKDSCKEVLRPYLPQ